MLSSINAHKSTGPRKPEGLERMRESKFRHGKYSKEAKAASQALRAFRETLARIKREGKESAMRNF